MTRLTAKELAKILLQHPDAIVNVAYDEPFTWGSGTPDTETQIEYVGAVHFDGSEFSITSDCFLPLSERVWPPKDRA